MWGRAGAVTSVAAIVGITISAVVVTLGMLRVNGEDFAVALTLYGDAFVEALAAGSMFYAVSRLENRLELSTWLAMASAVTLTAIGDALWVQGHSALGAPAVGLSVSDIAYFASYAVMAAAMLRYALSFRDRVDLPWMITETLVATSLCGATLWVVLLAPGVRALGTITSGSAINLLYVFIDFPLLFAPVLLVVLVMLRHGDEQGVRPWIMAAVGVLATIIADVGWFWERAHGIWQPGSLVDFGYMAANVFFAVAALTAVDVQEYRRRRREAA